MENLRLSNDADRSSKRRTDRNVCPTPDTTMPHKVNCMAEWGKNREVPDSIIVGSGAYVSP
jgi:hypothetical protein